MRERPPTNTNISERSVSLVVLGTGHGSSMVYNGVVSASYVLCVDKDPVLLIGAGYGVVQQCLKYFGRIPSDVFVSSNRSHVAAELPVLLACEANRRSEPIRLLGHPAVLQRIESHRLAELHDVMMSRPDGVDSLVNLCDVPPLQEGGTEDEDSYDHATGVVLQDAPGISVRSFVTNTSECSAGVAVFCSHSGGARLFAICGDSREPRRLFQTFGLQKFHVVVLDARRESSSDHSSFDEVVALESDEALLMEGDRPLQRWCIGHYGSIEEAPTLLGRHSRTGLIVEGTVIHTRLLVALRMHDEVGAKRFVNAEHHGNSVRVDEVRIAIVRDASAPAKHKDVNLTELAKDFALPPEKAKKGSLATSWRRGVESDQRNAAAPYDAHTVQRAASPSIVSRLQQPTQSSSFRRHGSVTRASPSASKRSLSNQRGHVHLDASDDTSSTVDVLTAPKRVYLFTNEDKSAPGRMVMAQMFRTVQQLKQRVAEVLQMKPVGELHVMPSGEVVTSLQQLTHGCSVVVTRGGGERFHLHRLPKALSNLPRTAVSASSSVSLASVGASPSPPRNTNERVPSSRRSPPRAPKDNLVANADAADRRAAAQFHDYMAQAAAILSSEHRQASIIEPKDRHLTASRREWEPRGVVVAGSLPMAGSTSIMHSAGSSESDLEDIFGTKAAPDAAPHPPSSTGPPLLQDQPAHPTDVPSDSAATAASRKSSIGSKRMVFTMVA